MSETNDLQAARERWKRGVHPVVGADGYLIERSRDAYLLADAYLSLLDETPITEEWAESIRSANVMLFRSRGEWELRVFDDCELVLFFAAVKTQGQLRCLLLAMGVTHE